MEEKKSRKATSKKKDQEVYTDLETKAKKWQFKNPNRVVMIERSEITNYDLLNNQELAQILISKGLGDLICLE